MQLFFTAGTQSLPHVQAGRLKAARADGGKRSALLPDVPIVAETVPGYEMTVWYGSFGPAGMPAEIVARLNAEIARALFIPDVKKRMADIAVEVASSTPEELAARMRADAEKWGGDHQGPGNSADMSAAAQSARAEHVVPNSSGSEAPKLKAPANACDCHMHIYDGARFPPARPGPQSRMQEKCSSRQYRSGKSASARRAP